MKGKSTEIDVPGSGVFLWKILWKRGTQETGDTDGPEKGDFF